MYNYLPVYLRVLLVLPRVYLGVLIVLPRVYLRVVNLSRYTSGLFPFHCWLEFSLPSLIPVSLWG